MNSSKELIFKNNKNILNAPINAPNNILIILTFLLSIIETLVSNKKSKAKLSIKMRSKYNFIYITKNSIKKRQVLFCLFI